MAKDVFEMCFEGDVEGVRKALEADDKLWLHYKNKEGSTALFLATGPGHLEIVKLLVEAGANLNTICKNITPLMLASRRGRTEIVKYLLEKGASVLIKAPIGDSTALHEACEFGHLEIAKLLIDKGADVYAEDEAHQQPLSRAVLFERENVINYLLGLGEFVGLDALINACAYEDDLDIIKDLIKHGVNVNGMSRFKETPLYAACYKGNMKAAYFLLLCGADINKKSVDDKTPLQAAKWYKPLQDLLISWGKDEEI